MLGKVFKLNQAVCNSALAITYCLLKVPRSSLSWACAQYWACAWLSEFPGVHLSFSNPKSSKHFILQPFLPSFLFSLLFAVIHLTFAHKYFPQKASGNNFNTRCIPSLVRKREDFEPIFPVSHPDKTKQVIKYILLPLELLA